MTNGDGGRTGQGGGGMGNFQMGQGSGAELVTLICADTLLSPFLLPLHALHLHLKNGKHRSKESQGSGGGFPQGK